MWAATVDGQRLHFHLSGINNQNFIMQDEETGSWWQQVTGTAIFGPLAGRSLEAIDFDELTFATWKREQPGGRVLRPAANPAWERFSDRWEEQTAKMPVVTRSDAADPLPPRAVIFGIERAGAAKAYPRERLELEEEGAIVDSVGGVPLILVLGEDRRSVRAFEASLAGRELSLFVKTGTLPLRILDAGTGRSWDFAGNAADGSPLRKIPVLTDYWFDWKTYHPATELSPARRPRSAPSAPR